MFFDQAKIHVAAGNGGNGCVSFRREKHVPKGGPDGGDGGHGGDVVLVADPQVRDLQQFSFKIHFKGGPGHSGMGARKHGANGDTVRIPVPVGTQVWVEGSAGDDTDEAADAEPRLVADMVGGGQEIVIANGGAGGRGNTRFTNSVHQAPKFAELGEKGEAHWLRLSLKLMADAGLAGMPNAGKSSLLKRVSNAKPKVADYPFTTLEPMLGVVDWSGEGDVFTLADVPGLLEGASEGVGLGHEFLAHLERCFLLVHVVDISGMGEAEPLSAFRTILRELGAHAGGLAEKPQLVVLSKIDTVTPAVVEQHRKEFCKEIERLRGEEHPAFCYAIDSETLPTERIVWPVSASTGAGLRALLRWTGPLLRELGAERDSLVHPEAAETTSAREGGHVVYQPTGRNRQTFTVRRVKKGFVVEGEAVRRLVRRFDLGNEEATRYVAEKFERLGVYAALRSQGAQPGDEVDVEGYAFEFN